MARTFNDLIGVVGTDKNNKACYNFPPNEEYKITSVGDSIFKVNVDNMTVEHYNVKFRSKHDGYITLYICKFDRFRKILPFDDRYHYHRGNSNLNLFEKISVKGTVSHCGLYFLNLKDAAKCLDDIRNGKFFKNLKKGDTVFLADKNTLSIHELIVDETNFSFNNVSEKYTIKFEDGKCVSFDSIGVYDKNASYFSLKYFHFRYIEDKLYSFHIDKADAERVINECIKRKEAANKKKQEEAEKNKNGTPIDRKDCKRNELHVGDKVAYIKSITISWSGTPTLGLGVVVSASGKEKIKVFDEEEKNSNTPKSRWTKDEICDGLHILFPTSVMLIEKFKKQ